MVFPDPEGPAKVRVQGLGKRWSGNSICSILPTSWTSSNKMNNKHRGFSLYTDFIYFFQYQGYTTSRLYSILQHQDYTVFYNQTSTYICSFYSHSYMKSSGNDPSEPSGPLFTNIYNIWGYSVDYHNTLFWYSSRKLYRNVSKSGQQ